MRTVVHCLAGLLLLPLLFAAPAVALTGEQATQAVHRFIDAWNTRDPAAFAATLRYPHVRPTAAFDGRVFADAGAYAATTDFDQVLATGWDRSRLDSATVVQAGDGQAHVAGRYTRLRADGSAIWSNQVTYVVVEKDGSTGIQARFAAGFDDLSEAERETNASAAVAVINRYLEAFNARDEEAMVATFQFPHVRVGGGEVRVSNSAAEYMDSFDFDAFAERLGWVRSEWDTVEAVQVGARGVNLAISGTRYGPGGSKIHSFDGLYLITEQDGRWGIRAGSGMSPRR